MSRIITVEIEPQFLDELSTARGSLDTRSEVIFVLPRRCGTVLTTRKPFYPEGVFRIPSGGIHPGETPEQAFLRETMEETSLNVEPVGRIAEVVNHCVAGDRHVDITSYIILGSSTEDQPHASDLSEEIELYGEANVAELRRLADLLGSLGGRWAGWGRFRATAHLIVAEYLAGSHD